MFNFKWPLWKKFSIFVQKQNSILFLCVWSFISSHDIMFYIFFCLIPLDVTPLGGGSRNNNTNTWYYYYKWNLGPKETRWCFVFEKILKIFFTLTILSWTNPQISIIFVVAITHFMHLWLFFLRKSRYLHICRANIKESEIILFLFNHCVFCDYICSSFRYYEGHRKQKTRK